MQTVLETEEAASEGGQASERAVLANPGSSSELKVCSGDSSPKRGSEAREGKF